MQASTPTYDIRIFTHKLKQAAEFLRSAAYFMSL